MAGAAAVAGLATGPGGSALDPVGSASLMASLTADEQRELREYERLLRFRDEVVGGSHPRIKPSHLPAKPTQGQNNASVRAATSFTVRTPTQPGATKAAAKAAANNNARPVIDNLQSHQTNKQHSQVNMASSLPGIDGGGRPQINPVLLEKSDDLIKAEIQLQRQRVERSLREQLEQRRGAGKGPEQLPELDVADVLAKAMSLVHATPAAQPTTDDTAANASASNDSSDDNTFYSSRHDTPESNMAARLPTESEDEEMREGSPYEPELDFEPVVQVQQMPPNMLPTQAPAPVVAPPQPQQQTNAPVLAQASSAVGVAVPGLHIGASRSTVMYEPRAAETGGAMQSSGESRTDESSQAGSGQLSSVHNLARVNERLLEQAVVREPPVVRAHDLSPVAPQPTHAVPPAIAGEPRLTSGDLRGGGQAAPAQVTALRKQGSNGSSPESSPQGSRGAEKKKNKKKKRKADRLAPEPAPASPYIKPEPRSPSPLTPQYARPTKRQRYSQQQPLVIQDDEPRYEPRMPVEDGYQERYQPRIVRQERVVGYERAGDYSPRHGEETILVTSPRYERVYYDDYRAPPPSGYPTAPEPIQHVSREVRTVRPATRVVETPYEEGATYYRDVRAASRMSVRPAAYPERSPSPVGYERPVAAMPPPPPRRIIVDAFGREYLEPARPATVVREEVAAEPRGPYERALPPRALSRRPEPLDDGAALYRTTSPAYASARRVVTQPEYSYRDGGRPSSILPVPPGEYLPSRPEVPREYIARSASVRPALEPSRYDPALSAYERVPAPPLDERLQTREYYRAATARPAEPAAALAARYEPVAYERHPVEHHQHHHQPHHEPIPLSARDFPPSAAPPPLRSASVRPAAEPPAARYEIPPEYAPSSSSRRVEYAAAPSPAYPPHHHHQQQQQQQQHYYPSHQDGRRDNGASAMLPPHPPAGPGSSGERYYGRGPLPGQGVAQDEEVVFVDRREGGGYREVR